MINYNRFKTRNDIWNYLNSIPEDERTKEDKTFLNQMLIYKKICDEADIRCHELQSRFKSFKKPYPNSQYYDMEGKPITSWQHYLLCEPGRATLQIAETFSNGFRISTVFLGIDHNWGSSDRPIIFETMIFAKTEKLEKSDLHEYQERYCTKEEALEGHKRACNMVMNSI